MGSQLLHCPCPMIKLGPASIPRNERAIASCSIMHRTAPYTYRLSPVNDGSEAMTRITLIGAGLILLASAVAANAQGVGYPPGVNPSNPQDLTYRSNPQDLSVPGASNPQDLVRPPPRVNGPLVDRPGVTSVSPSPSLSPSLRYTVRSKSKPKPKRKPRQHGPTARR